MVEVFTPKAPFIVGVPRSGTTLLRMMFDSHPDIAIPPETDFLNIIFDRNLTSSQEVKDTILTSPRWNDFGITREILASAWQADDARDLGAIVRSFYHLYSTRHGKSLWGDKTPRYGPYCARIASLLSEAYVCHIIRDGRDVYVSSRATHKRPLTPTVHAGIWVDYIKSVRQAARSVPNYVELRYEKLVAEPASVLEWLCSKLYIRFEQCMLEYPARAVARLDELNDLPRRKGPPILKNERLIWHENVKRAPDLTRINRWREVLTHAEAMEYNNIAGDLLLDLGYELM
jgi:hypothetical protein